MRHRAAGQGSRRAAGRESRPAAFAAYSASSARRSRSSGASPSQVAQPTLTVTAASPAGRAPRARSFSAVTARLRRRRRRAAAPGTPRRRGARAGPPRACARASRGRRRRAPVARGVAVRVVDRLEVVDVDDRDRQRALVAAGAADHAVELGEDEAAVGEAGERVLEQQRLQPLGLGDQLLLQHLGAPGRRTRATSSASRTGSTRKSCTPRLQRRRARSSASPVALDEHDGGAEGLGVALDRARAAPLAGAPSSTTATSGGARGSGRGRRRRVATRPPRGPPPPAPAAKRRRSARPPVGQRRPSCRRCQDPGRRTLNLVRPSSGDPARLVDVAVHLLDQRLDAVEAPLAAQALEEVEPQLAAVEVAVEVEQVRLDEQRRGRSRTSGRTPTLTAAATCHSPSSSGAAGVDAVAGQDERAGRARGWRSGSRACARACRRARRAAHLERARRGSGGARRPRRPTTRPRMWVEETISPSTSTSSTTRVSNASWARSSAGVALARGGRSGSSPPPTRARAPSRSTSTWSMNSCAVCAANDAVERDHDQLRDAEAGDQVGLDGQRREQLRRRVRAPRPRAGAARRSARCRRRG